MQVGLPACRKWFQRLLAGIGTARLVSQQAPAGWQLRAGLLVAASLQGVLFKRQLRSVHSPKRPCPTLLCGHSLDHSQVPGWLLWVVPLPLACSNMDQRTDM